jgi:hypothetical protein
LHVSERQWAEGGRALRLFLAGSLKYFNQHSNVETHNIINVINVQMVAKHEIVNAIKF